ncbi:L-asparaginase II [Paenibacillus sp. PvR052]|nr:MULTISPECIES: asparaginase [unclassified Paenibacillus]
MHSFDKGTLVEVTRGDVTESVHRGHIAAVDFKGKLIAYVGNPKHYGYMRSTAKLLQVIPLLETRGDEQFGLTDAETALCCASHGGEPEHASTALSILNKLELGESALECGRQEPLYKPAADALKQEGLTPSQLHNNCSGKHAGMLALAKAMNVSIKQYTCLAHPVQQKMLHTVANMCGVPAESIKLGIDGCGVPVFAVPLASLAYAYARLGSPEELSPERAAACRKIIEVICKYPYYVAGTNRFDTRLAEVTQGRIIGKMGAEGVYALTVPNRGIGLSVKIEDGAERALYPAAAEALIQLGAVTRKEADQLAEFHHPRVTNRRGENVGVIRPVFQLLQP